MNIRFEARIVYDQGLSMPITSNSKYHKIAVHAINEANDHAESSGDRCIVLKVTRQLVHDTDPA